MNENALNQLKTTLHELGIKSESSKKLFIEQSVIKQYQKSTTLFFEQKKNEKEYLLLEGVLFRYNIDDKGNIVTTGFYMAQTVITPHFARTINGQSLFTLETLTDVCLIEIPVSALNNLRSNNLEINRFGQKIVESELLNNLYNDIANRSYSAKERLLLLRKNYPNLENLVPHHIIASYLGITHVSFSRLRKELTKS